MKISIPKRTYIIDNTVVVERVKGLYELTHALGQNNADQHWIKIDDRLVEDEAVSTYMHELVEYCLSSLGCDISRMSEEPKYLLTHRELNLLARMLRQAIERAVENRKG